MKLYARAGQIFLGQLPDATLQAMASVRPTRVNRRMNRHIGEKVFEAGQALLEDIHKEIYNAKSQDEKDAIQAELIELAGGSQVVEIKLNNDGKPELTKEYLIAIGRPDVAEWGRD
jgi:hypothetical protein